VPIQLKTPAPSNTSAAAVRAGLDCDNHLAIFVNSEANTVQGVTEVGPRPSSGWPGHLGPYGRTTPDRSPRLGKPVELGYKAQVTENDDGVIVDHAVERGNPADGPQLAPAVHRVIQRAGRKPGTVTADRSYGEQAVEDDLRELGVRYVVIPRMGKPGKARRRTPTRVPPHRQGAHRQRSTEQCMHLPVRRSTQSLWHIERGAYRAPDHLGVLAVGEGLHDGAPV
jgi:Transposase DDE domain